MFAPLLLLAVHSPAQVRWEPLMEPGGGGAMVDISVSPHDPQRLIVTGDMLGLGLSVNRGDRWLPTFGLASYEMAAATWHPRDPKVVWCGSMAGPYRSLDGGTTWTLQRAGMPEPSSHSYSAPVEKVLFDPANADRLLAFGGSSRRWSATLGRPLFGVVWESTDAGESWTKLATLTAEEAGTDGSARGANIIDAWFAPDAPGVIYALADGVGFAVSEDSGRTWTLRNRGLPSLQVEKLALHPRDGRIAYLTLGNHQRDGRWVPGGVFVTRDAGRTWTDSSVGLSRHGGVDPNLTARFHGLAISASDPNILYTSETSWNLGAIYKSVDAGATWTMSASRQNHGNGNVADLTGAHQPDIATFAGIGMGDLVVDPTDPAVCFAINAEYILRTLDAGKTWTDATAERFGDGWRGRGYTGWCSRSIAFDPHISGRSLLTAMDAGRAWLSVDGLRSWRYGRGFNMPWMCGADAVFSAGDRAYAAYGQFASFQGVGRSEDGGLTWQVVAGAAHGLPELGAPVDPTAIYAPADDASRVAVAIGGALYVSRDGGQSFGVVRVPSGPIGDVAGDGGALVIACETGLWRSADWESFVPLGGPRPATRLAVSPGGSIYVTTKESERPGVWRLEGGAWTRLLDERFVWGIAVDPTNPARLAVTTNEDPYMDLDPAPGVLLSGDGGATWGLENSGLAMTRAHPIEFNPFDAEEIVVGTYGRGFFRARWPAGYVPGGRTYVATQEDVVWAQPQPTPASSVTLENGSMTLGDAVPDGWTGLWVGKGQVRASRDTVVFREGPASLRVDSEGDSEGQASRIIEAPGGTVLDISGWVRCRGPRIVSVGLQSLDASWTPLKTEQLKFVSGEQDWSRFEARATVALGSVRAQLCLYVQGHGSAWLDEVVLVESS